MLTPSFPFQRLAFVHMQLAYRTVTVAPAFWETNSFPTCSAFAAPQRRVLLLRVFSPAFPSFEVDSCPLTRTRNIDWSQQTAF